MDEYNLALGMRPKKFPGVQGPVPGISNGKKSIAVAGADFLIEFSRETGLITRGNFRGVNLIEGGPYLHLTAERAPEDMGWKSSGPEGWAVIDRSKWSLTGLNSRTDSLEAVIEISGRYGDTEVSFEVRIDGAGLMTTSYTIDRPPCWTPSGGFSEVGVSCLLSGKVGRLSWDRDALWSAYPEDHIGRGKGVAPRQRKTGKEAYGVPPAWPWSEDMKDFYLSGRDDTGQGGTKDFRSLKEYIRYASAVMAGTELRVRAESAGKDAVRLEVEAPNSGGRVKLIIDNQWNYPGLLWGNYMKSPIIISPGHKGRVRIRLTDNDHYSTAD